ncbi:CRISPR-associated endonuclease Cas2 [Candidatus Kaiserbacteria bacterium]|nr:CRISPR-associated endonuclease Cas2 [Candidatus Kaiserbacteria bacterium]
MGELEKEARYERRKGYLQQAVLSSIAIGGILALAMVAPNSLRLLDGLGSRKRRYAEQARSAVGRLAAKGHVKFVNVNGRKYVRITKAGRKALDEADRQAQLHTKPRKPRRWDKRWRLLVFDIPESRKITRNRLRKLVRSLGFLRLQDSVWVYPYDCEELVILIKADLRIGKDVLYAIVEKIENDAWIRRQFRLPL